jgi:hypothetical protein
MKEIKTQNDEEVKKEIIEDTRKFFWGMTPCSFECRSISTLKMMAACYSETLVPTAKTAMSQPRNPHSEKRTAMKTCQHLDL